MRISQLIIVALLLLASFANAAAVVDIYTCPRIPELNGQAAQATAIALYSGHPSEMAQLKPDNADTDDKSPLFWTMGFSEYDYWYVCTYKNTPALEFKLTKNYARCTNIGAGKVLDKLKCE
jgi:hypothetical protein